MADEQQEQQHETVTTTSTTGRNLHKLLSVGQLILEIDFRSDGPLCCCCCYCFMLLLPCNCHCVFATTDELQQQQHYTVTTIIKRLMITKILNNLCQIYLYVVVV